MMRGVFYRILNSGLWGGDSRSGGFSVSESQADELFEMGRLQAVGGLLMVGMEELGMTPGIQKGKWLGMLMHIEKKNRECEALAKRILDGLRAAGMNVEVFKGGSVAEWYRNPEVRSYGDIDVVISEGFGMIESILNEKGIVYRRDHQDVVCNIEGIDVEFHPQREYTYCPEDNRTLQQLVKDFPDSAEVYLACIIIHLRRHFLTHGVGMKQVCDVAVMLRNANLDMDFMAKVIRMLNMERFCSALFGFIKRRFGVESFPVAPDCGSYSLFIEETVWRDGYMLKFEREHRAKGISSIERVVGNAWFWIKRSIRMSAVMPREAAWFLPYMIRRRIAKR